MPHRMMWGVSCAQMKKSHGACTFGMLPLKPSKEGSFPVDRGTINSRCRKPTTFGGGLGLPLLEAKCGKKAPSLFDPQQQEKVLLQECLQNTMLFLCMVRPDLCAKGKTFAFASPMD